MKGSVHERKTKHGSWWLIKFWWENKQYTVSRYLGRRMRTREDSLDVLGMMRGDVDRGVFNPNKWTVGKSNVIDFLYEWLEECKGDWSPGNYKNYCGYIRNHLDPFFSKHRFQLHEVKLKQIKMLKIELEKKTDITPATRKKIIDCLSSAMDYAWRTELIEYPPPFPKAHEYQIVDPKPRATTVAMQIEILRRIPIEHQAIFLAMKFHPKIRPAAAMMLYREDYDKERQTFTLHRGISGGEEVEYVKDKKVKTVALDPDFIPIMQAYESPYPLSPYLFTCRESHHPDKRYTKDILRSLVVKACEAAGVKYIHLYALTKHTTVTAMLKHLSPEQAKIVTGHATIKSVYRYGHVSVEDERALMKKAKGEVIPFKKKEVSNP